MIRLKARDGEVKVYDDVDTNALPIGKLDIYWAASDLYRVWMSQSDMAKLRNSEIMRWAVD